MGTRADFYVGRGPKAEWLGSIAYDGYPDGVPEDAIAQHTEEDFRAEVEKILATDESATRPAKGWPWPWDNSGTTDYAYAFDDGEVHIWDGPDYPDMSGIRVVAQPGSARSGVLMFATNPK